MDRIKVSNQAELDAALKNGQYPICIGDRYFDLPNGAKADATDSSTVTAYGSSTVTATGSSTVRAYGNSTVTAYGSSTVRAYGSSTVTAYGSSTVRAYGSSTVRAYGSSTVRATDSSTVTAYGSSTVTATDSSTVTAYGSSTVRAGRYAAIHIKGESANVTGGVQIRQPEIRTPEEWCDVYGVEVNDGIAIVYKGVNDDYSSPRGGQYTPGTAPTATDWDGGARECGGGLHFSPSPGHTLSFHGGATRFLACPVALADISIHFPAEYPEKIKARGCCAPVYEVDIHGRPV